MAQPSAERAMVTKEDVRRALAASGGDLRAVGAELGLETRELLMILAYDVTVTATGQEDERIASGGDEK